jgi:hypothetical protein
MEGRVNDSRVEVRQLSLLVALMVVGYLCIRTLRFTNDLLNVLFVCAFLLIPFLAIRPVLQLRRWSKVVTTILLCPLLVLSPAFLLPVSCDVPAVLEHREFSREVASVRQGFYSVHLMWQQTAGGGIGPHGLGFEQRMSIAPGLYVVRHLDYFEGVSKGSLSSAGADEVRLRIPESYGHQEIDKCIRLSEGFISDHLETSLASPASSGISSPYSFAFTLTTVIFENPSSNVGGFNLPAILRITSSWTTR